MPHLFFHPSSDPGSATLHVSGEVDSVITQVVERLRNEVAGVARACWPLITALIGAEVRDRDLELTTSLREDGDLHASRV